MTEEKLDKSNNTYTDEELKEILEQHRLWSRTEGMKGKKANFFNAILIGVKLQHANLQEINIQRAILANADLQGADLQGADLRNATLQGANLANANLLRANITKVSLQGVNINGTVFDKEGFESAVNQWQAYGQPFILNTILQQPTELQEKQSQIKQLEQELQQLKQVVKREKENITKDKENNETIKQEIIKNLETELTQAKKDKEKLEVQLQEKLNTEIKNAQNALANSLKNTDERIKEYGKNAKWIGWGAIGLIALDLGAIIHFWVCHEKLISLLGEFQGLGVWALTLYSFPILIVFSIAITLLRHQKKLLDEVRHYSADKRQIELYSGLLEASQHAAAGLNDPQKSAEYVHETFTTIRDRILNEPTHTNTAGSAVEKEEYSSSLEPLIKVISDMIAKSEVKK